MTQLSLCFKNISCNTRDAIGGCDQVRLCCGVAPVSTLQSNPGANN